MTSSNPKQSGSKGTANASSVWHEAARNGMHVDRDIIERVQAQPNADTQVGSEGVKARTPVGFFDLDTGLAIWD
jgi:hypothetical protein